MIHLEQNPNAGEALLGSLMGWRKITVGDRDWRLVWGVTDDEAGSAVIDVAEVWAFGARSDAEVYDEMHTRVAAAPQTARTAALADVLVTLGKLTEDLQAAPEPTAPEQLPKCLREALLYVMQLPAAQVDGLTRHEADQLWLDYTTGRGR